MTKEVIVLWSVNITSKLSPSKYDATHSTDGQLYTTKCQESGKLISVLIIFTQIPTNVPATLVNMEVPAMTE